MSAKLKPGLNLSNFSNLSLLYDMYTVQKSEEEKGCRGKKKEIAKINVQYMYIQGPN